MAKGSGTTRASGSRNPQGMNNQTSSAWGITQQQLNNAFGLWLNDNFMEDDLKSSLEKSITDKGIDVELKSSYYTPAAGMVTNTMKINAKWSKDGKALTGTVEYGSESENGTRRLQRLGKTGTDYSSKKARVSGDYYGSKNQDLAKERFISDVLKKVMKF